MTKFEITKKKNIGNNGNEYTTYYLKRTIFGIPFYKWDFNDFISVDNFNFISSMFLLLGTVCFGVLMPFLHFIPILLLSIYVGYKMGKKKYYLAEDAEEDIKIYLKKNNFKSLKEETISSYNIDLKNGVVEKSAQTRNLN